MLEYDKNTCQEKKEIKEDTSMTDSSEILPYFVMDFFSLWSLQAKNDVHIKKEKKKNWDSLCKEIACNKSLVHTRSLMAINIIAKLFPWPCASLLLESSTAHRNIALRKPQSSLPLASQVVDHRIRELWLVVQMKDTWQSMEWQQDREKDSILPLALQACRQTFQSLVPSKDFTGFWGWGIESTDEAVTGSHTVR